MADHVEQSDVSLLWDQALNEYAQTSKVDIRSLLSARKSVTSIMMEQQHQLESFTSFRHNKGKVDKLRNVIASNADIIVTVAGHVADAASVAFPPSAAILTAFTYVMNASKHVSEDYDMIESYFDIMQSFLQRLSLLENRIPPLKRFQLFIVHVFSSLLSLSALARAYCLKGRFTKWAKALVDGKDPELQAAYGTLNENLGRLESAVIMHNLRVTLEVKEEAKDTNQNVRALQAQTKQLQISLDDNTLMTEKTLDVAEKLTVIGLETGAGMKEVVVLSRDSAAMNQEMLRRQDKISQEIMKLKLQSTDDKKKKSEIRSGISKSANLDRFRNFVYLSETTMAERMQDLEIAYVPTTFDWVQDDLVYNQVVEGDQRFLCIEGTSGMGKSVLAHKVYRDLREKFVHDAKTTVATYLFDEEYVDYKSVMDMLKWCSVKAAEKDIRYCESTLVELRRYGLSHEVTSPALARLSEQLIELPYAKGSAHRLIMVLDGINENDEANFEYLLQFFRRIVEKECQVQVIFSSEPDKAQALSEFQFPKIDLTREKVHGDMRRVAWFQAKSLPKLRKMRTPLRKTIIRKVSNKADSFLYIEHTMRRLNSLGREGLILKELEKLPETTTALYETLLQDCQVRRTPDELEVLRNLFAWLTYAKSRITVREANKLIDIIAKENSLRIEEEIDGRLSRLLRISGRGEYNDQEESSSENDFEAVVNDSVDNVVEQARDEANLVGFQERSLRAYFRQTMSDDHGLRCTANEAHAIILRIISNILTAQKNLPDRNDLLQNYAAQNALTHFLEISEENVSDAVAKNVLESLFNILSNRNDALRIVEDMTDGEGIIESSMRDKILSKFKIWARRAAQLPPNSLAYGVLDWIRPLSREPSRIFISLARAHINNWFSSDNIHSAHYSFRCALLSLDAGKQLPELQQNPVLRDYFAETGDSELSITEKSFDVVANAFWDIVKTSASFRGIGMAMKRNGFYSASTVQFETGLKDDTINDYQRYSLLTSHGDAQLQLGLNEPDEQAKKKWFTKAIDTLDQAIKIYHGFSEDFIKNDELGNNFAQNFENRAHAAACMGLFNMVTPNLADAKAAGSDFIGADVICQIVSTMVQGNEPAQVMQILKMLTTFNFAYYFYYFRHNSKQAEMAAIKANQGQELYDMLLAASVGMAYGDMKAGIRIIASKFAYQALRNIEAAKQLLRVNMHDTLASLSHVLTSAQMLAEILFEEFRLSTTPVAKKVALDEVKRILTKLQEVHGDDFDRSESNIAVAQGLMLRKLGPTMEYHDVLQAAFDTCVKQLTDSISANDNSALRHLARILFSLPGFDYDASVAYTASAYALDPEQVRDDESIKDDSISPVSEEVKEIGETEDSGVREEAHSNKNVDRASDDGPIETALSNGTSNEGLSKNESTTEAKTPKSSITTAPESTPDVDPEATTQLSQRQEMNEGLNSELFYCNYCGDEYVSWADTTGHFCLYCIDCDICGKCWLKRESPDDEKSRSRVICPSGHVHIKGPVKGWRGVKDGKLRIDSQEIPFQEWFSGVQVKWKAYWQKYWAELI